MLIREVVNKDEHNDNNDNNNNENDDNNNGSDSKGRELGATRGGDGGGREASGQRETMRQPARQ